MAHWPSAAASALVGLALAGVAFGARGGSQLTRTTLIELALIAVGGCLFAAALARARRFGAVTLVLFGCLVGLTAASLSWSIAPGLSWLEANRALAYLAALASGVAAAWIAPRQPAVLLRGVLLAVALVVAYGLASRVWPGALAADETYARIGQPYGYWNALGTTAALGVPPALWLGSRRSGHGAASALAYPLLGLLWVALALSFSRGALAAAAVGAAAWLLLVPLRLRSLTLLSVSLAGAAPVTLWAVSREAFTADAVPLSVREAVSADFGLLLALTAIGLLAAGLAVGFRLAGEAPSPTLRLRVGLVAAAAAVAGPLALLGAVALSERGLVGTVNDRTRELTSEQARTPGGAERLTAVSSSRARYWRQAGRIFQEHPEVGAGAGTFGLARLRHRPDALVARHAHGYVPQVMADLGLAGLAITLALALAWLGAAGRATGALEALRRRGGRPPPGWDADRVAVAALALAAVVFALHSALDWTWFVPGPAVMALVCAGWVAGRAAPGALLAPPSLRPSRPVVVTRALPAAAASAPVSRSFAEAGAPAPPGAVRRLSPTRGIRRPEAGVPSDADSASGAGEVRGDPYDETPTAPARGPGPPMGPSQVTRELPPLEPLSPRPSGLDDERQMLTVPRLSAALAVLVATLAAMWAVWQPERADRLADRALLETDAGQLPTATATARRALEIDPLSVRPRLVQASVAAAAGRQGVAVELLRGAVRDQPNDPALWLALAQAQADGLGDTRAALDSVRSALYVDPQSPTARELFLSLRVRLAREQASAAPPGDEILP